MSGQAKRTRVRAAMRHRKAVAREIAGCVELYWYTGDICQSLGWCDAADAILGEYAGRLNAVTFDVHAAREHALALSRLRG